MSDAEQQQATDILLPAARVIVFSRDEETLASAKSLSGDWRFSRVDLRVIEGDVQSAAQTFQSEGRSPDLVIIQTDDIDDSFTQKLGDLSMYCDEGTAAIIVGPVNDVYLYRNLIGMGVSDYLVRPIRPEMLQQVISKTLISKLGLSGSALIAFIGAKGGVGTSTLLQASALLASTALDQKVMILDAGGAHSSLGVGLGFDPSTTLAELSRAIEQKQEDSLKRMIFNASDNLSAVAGGSDAMLDPPITSDQFEKIINKFMVKSPVVMVDLSNASAALKRIVITRANRIVLVTTPSVTSLRFARSLLKEISEVRGGDQSCTSLLVNFQGMAKAHEVSAADINAALEFKPAATIPFMPVPFLGGETDSEKLLKDRDLGEVLRSALLPIIKSALSVDGSAGDGKDKKGGLIGGFLTKLTSK